MPRKPKVTTIRISFVDRSGKETSFTELTPKPIRFLPHTTWSKEAAICRFAWYLARGDGEGLDASLEALRRLGCLLDAIRHCDRSAKLSLTKTHALMGLWMSRGLHAIPRALGDDLPEFAALIKKVAPKHDGPALTLYRGQSLERFNNGVIGIAWSGRLSRAQFFGSYRTTQGVVLELEAAPDMIAAYMPTYSSSTKANPKSGDEFEDEYLIDPRPYVAHIRAIQTVEPI